jgi:hypothetical protein
MDSIFVFTECNPLQTADLALYKSVVTNKRQIWKELLVVRMNRRRLQKFDLSC